MNESTGRTFIGQAVEVDGKRIAAADNWRMIGVLVPEADAEEAAELIADAVTARFFGTAGVYLGNG
jgi:hypothetical protein